MKASEDKPMQNFYSVFLSVIVGMYSSFIFGCAPRISSKGWEALNKGDLEGARELVEDGVKSHSNSKELRDLMLRIGLLSRDWDSAVKSYKEFKRLAYQKEVVAARRLMVAQTIWWGLKEEDVSIRRESAKLAQELGVGGLGEVLKKAVEDEDVLVRAYAYGAMLPENFDGWLGLMKLSHFDDPLIRKAAAQGMGKVVDREYVFDVLLRLSRDEDPEVRAAAVGALSRVSMKNKKLFNSMLEVLRVALKDPAGPVRGEAAYRLARIKARIGFEWSVEMLQDPELAVRLAAFRAMKGKNKNTEALQKVAQGDNMYVAFRAEVALAKRGKLKNCGLALKKGMSAKNWAVRAAAVNAASSMPDCVGARDVVKKGMEDPHVKVKISAARAALNINWARERALQTLNKISRGRGEDAARAAEVLALKKNKLGIERLRELVSGGTPVAKIRALEVLGRLGDGRNSVLDGWAGGPWSVRLAAAKVMWGWWGK